MGGARGVGGAEGGMRTLVTAWGVFRGDGGRAEAKLRLAVTKATGREATAEDAAALTLLRATDHPIFGDTDDLSPEEANAEARLFMRIHD